MMRKVVALAATALFLTGSVSHAQLATFDDLAGCVSTNGGGIGFTSYKGFSWDNFYVANGQAATTETGGAGYLNGTVTKPCVSLNGFGAASSLTSASDFTFNGGFFTAAFTNGLSVAIKGLNSANAEIFSTTLSLNTAGPQLLNVVWAGVRTVTFASGDNQPGSQFAFDNFRFNNTVDPIITAPEPSTYVLMGAGLVAMGLVSRRRRRA